MIIQVVQPDLSEMKRSLQPGNINVLNNVIGCKLVKSGLAPG